MGLFVVWMVLGEETARAGDRRTAMALAVAAEREAAQGELAAAIRTLLRAEAADPSWLELKVNLAALLSQAGDHAGAIRAARAALAVDPALAGARFNLGLAQFKSGDYEGAMEALGRYRGDRSAPTSVHVALGLSAAALGRPAEAGAELSLAVEAGSSDPAVLFALVRARREEGDAAGAATARDRLRTVAPDSAASLMLDGDEWDAGQDWGRAEAAYRQAVAGDPRFPGAHYSLGLMLYKRGAYAEAARELDLELAQRPDDIPALHYRALLDLDAGNAEAALPRLERLATVAAGRVDVLRDLGRAQIAAGRSKAAIATLRRAVALVPTDPRCHFLLSRALKADGQQDAAREEALLAAEMNRRVRERLRDRLTPPREGKSQ